MHESIPTEKRKTKLLESVRIISEASDSIASIVAIFRWLKLGFANRILKLENATALDKRGDRVGRQPLGVERGFAASGRRLRQLADIGSSQGQDPVEIRRLEVLADGRRIFRAKEATVSESAALPANTSIAAEQPSAAQSRP